MTVNLIFVVILAENQKIFKVGKIRKYDEETKYFEKKYIHLLIRHLYQNGKLEKMPMVAGLLVLISTQLKLIHFEIAEKGRCWLLFKKIQLHLTTFINSLFRHAKYNSFSSFLHDWPIFFRIRILKINVYSRVLHLGTHATLQAT